MVMWGSDFGSSKYYFADTYLLQPHKFLLYSVAGFLNDRIATADAEGHAQFLATVLRYCYRL